MNQIDLCGIDEQIKEVNSRLSVIGKISIERRGKSLYIRALLPAKPNDKQQQAKWQRISLEIPTTFENLAQAEKEAKLIIANLDLGRFNWNDYLRTSKDINTKTCSDWIRDFEQDYFERRKRTHKTMSTWKADYASIFKNLPVDSKLTPTLVKKIIVERTKPDTRRRRGYCLSLRALCKFAGIDLNIEKLIGDYSPSSVSPRNLPTDVEIENFFYQIPDTSWRWYYGMVATFGLRPSEVFYVDLAEFAEDPYVANAQDGKTGQHYAIAYHPQWVEKFELAKISRPNIKLDRPASALSMTADKYFFKLNMPFHLYDLRHCWAIRAAEYGLEGSIASKGMGNSLTIYNRSYHRWMDRKVLIRAYRKTINNSNEPYAN